MRGAADTKVLHIADYSSPYPGGFVPMLVAAAHYIAARGWSMEVLLPRAASEREWFPILADTVEVGLLPPQSLGRLAQTLRRRAQTTTGDLIIHTHFLTFDLPAMLAAAATPRTHVVWHKHGSLPHRPKDVVRGIMKYGVLARRVDAIVCVAPSVVAEMRRRGAPKGRVHYIINGIDIAGFSLFSEPERALARAALDLSEGDRVVLHFGYDWALKGGDLFVRAIARLRSHGERVVGITVGGGEQARVAADRIAAKGVIRPIEATSDVRRLYAAADVFASSSTREGMPFAVIEALCLGVPVAATSIPPHRYFAHLSNVRVVPANDRELAASVSSLFNRDPQAAAVSGAESRAWVRSHFDLKLWAERLGALYDMILNPPPGRAASRC